MMDRESGWQMVTEFVKDWGLRRHMLSVEAAMRWYARHLGENEERWGLAGLLHDFDWEIHSNLEQHPMQGAAILRQRGADEDTVHTILSHYTEGTGVRRERPIDFALLACDEITGLIVATTLVRPTRDIREVTVKSIQKKWKVPAFAAGVDRGHVAEATSDFSQACFEGRLELWEHIGHVLAAMQSIAVELALAGQI